MARFVFGLEAVLRQRKHVEEEKQRAFAAVQAQMAAMQNELKSINDGMQTASDDLRKNHLTGRIDMSFLAAHRRFTIAVQRKAMTLMQRIALFQRQVDEARAALAAAAKDRKAIEKLREKQHERWRGEQMRKELADLDEIGTQLAYRQVTEAAAASYPG
jgi:flagellar FliJ protein